MLRELLETEHELVHTRYRISHENRGTIGQTVYVFSDFILLDSDLCVCDALKAAMSYREMRCDDANIVHFDVWGRFSSIVHVSVRVGLV